MIESVRRKHREAGTRVLLDAMLEEYPEHGHAIDAAYREWNLANHDRLLQPYEGVESLLRDLRTAGVTTGVVTSKRRKAAEMALRGTGLTGLIDLVATLESTATHKPRPEPLIYAAGVLEVEPGECAYVGDAAVDVLAAKAAGMAAVAVTWGAGTTQALADAGADHLCTTVDELRALLLP